MSAPMETYGGSSPATRVYRLGHTFVDDHRGRDLPEDPAAIHRVVRETKTTVEVELDSLGFEELLSDARYYAAEMSGAGYDDGGVCRAAARVVAALESAGAPNGERIGPGYSGILTPADGPA